MQYQYGVMVVDVASIISADERTCMGRGVGREKLGGRQTGAVLDVCVQVLGHWGCRTASVRRGQGCPMPGTANSSQLQKGPATGQNWILQPHWWHLLENVFEKEQNTAQAERSKEKSVKNSLADTKIRGFPGARGGASLQLQEQPGWSWWMCPEYLSVSPRPLLTKRYFGQNERGLCKVSNNSLSLKLYELGYLQIGKFKQLSNCFLNNFVIFLYFLYLDWHREIQKKKPYLSPSVF